MKNNFSPSINLLRDAQKEFHYLPTANARRIVQQLVNDYKIGIRAFTMIGSYGTGKSAFLVALQQNLYALRNDFDNLYWQFREVSRFTCWDIVGEYRSLRERVANDALLSPALKKTNQLFDALDLTYRELHAQKTALIIVIDEFGKFLEYAAAHNPEQELYFIQQLAEYVNDSSKNILLLTTLHQGFDAYARGLNIAQRQEWEKVKGRLKELTFNEPVELLLNLAAEHLTAQARNNAPVAHLTELTAAIRGSKTFPHRAELSAELAAKLTPFDPLAAAVLTLALQQYGQNERSLFTFLNSFDRFSINDYDAARHPFYNLACVYDYLLHNYYSFLSTKYNPHYTQWAAIKRAVERIEGTFETQANDAEQLVKTVGLLNIFASVNARIDNEFLTSYARWSLGIPDAETLLDKLEQLKIIRFVVFKQKFILFEGTDLDFELALLDAATKIDAVNDVVAPLKQHFDFPYLLAKSVSYQRGTPRFFKFELSEEPLDAPPQGEIDGVINLLFSEHLALDALQACSREKRGAILYGLYGNTRQIRDMLFEIKKTEYVIENNQEDLIAVQELRALNAHQTDELNQYVLSHLYESSHDVTWVFAGDIVQLKNVSAFNTLLSTICERAYPQTPIFRNELVNRHKLPAVISTARRNFIRALTERWMDADLGFPKDNFPPEKTIYLTLLNDTGIHRAVDAGFSLGSPNEPSFQALWEASEAFLTSAKPARKNLSEFVRLLADAPLKLKQGVIDFWLPTFLFIRREDIAVYHEAAYLPELNAENLELIVKKPERFEIKTFDVQGVKLDLFNKYRALVHHDEQARFTNASFLETVKPFLTFYRALPTYAKQTKSVSPEAQKLRDVIANATDPEKTFFEDFPRALDYRGFDLKEADDEQLKAFIYQLTHGIKELQSCFQELLNRLERHILAYLGEPESVFPAYRDRLKARFASLKTHLLPTHLTSFHNRVLTEFGDRQAWLEAVVHAVLHKKLSEMKDEEEQVVTDRLSHAFEELDNLCDIAQLVADPEQEQVFKVEVTSYGAGSQERLVRLPKKTETAERHLEDEVETALAQIHDKRVKIDVLIKLLQRELRP